MSGPTVAFWQERFATGTTPWDRGAPGPQLVAWLGSEVTRGDTVVVPGCGAGWDVEALADFGARVTGIDYAPLAVATARERVGDKAAIVEADVLAWSPDVPVDAIYEQTCLCALHPDDWARYAGQLHRWLRPDGRLLAMFMQKRRPGAAEGFIDGPPYHCDINAMRSLFPSTRWSWPKPPYPATAHAIGAEELGVLLVRR